MFLHSNLIDDSAKHIAIIANNMIEPLIESVFHGKRTSPEVTGLIISLMPHIAEKAIITCPSIPSDILSIISVKFVDEFEYICKKTANMGGFSNPVKKTLFNLTFHRMYRQSYTDLKGKFDKVWSTARTNNHDPIEYMTGIIIFMLKQNMSISLSETTDTDRVTEKVRAIFTSIHAALK